MKLSKVTSGGRITVPNELRKKYNLSPGLQVRFEIEQDGIKITPLTSPDEIKTNIGFLGTKGMLFKALAEEKNRERKL